MQIIFTPMKLATINNGKPYAYVAKNKDTGDVLAYMHINTTPQKPIWANGIGIMWKWGVDIKSGGNKPLPAEEIGKLCEVFTSLNEAKKWVRDFYAKTKVTFKAFRHQGDKKSSFYDVLVGGQVVDQIWFTEGNRWGDYWSYCGQTFTHLSLAKQYVRQAYANGEAMKSALRSL